MLPSVMFGPPQPLPFPQYPFASSRIPSSAALCELRVSPSSSRSLFGLSLFYKKGQKITPLFSDSSALFKKECFDNPLPFNSFRTLLQNIRSGSPQVKISSRPFSILSAPGPSLATKSRRIRTYAKRARNPFTIRTSKTQHLKPFRMNTYEKTRGGPQPVLFLLRPKQIRNIQVLPLPASPFGNALAEMEA
jgi:hypothetical protein